MSGVGAERERSGSGAGAERERGASGAEREQSGSGAGAGAKREYNWYIRVYFLLYFTEFSRNNHRKQSELTEMSTINAETFDCR